MTATPTQTTCAGHGRRPAIVHCVGCGRGCCQQCIVPTGVGLKCLWCTGRPAAGVGRRRRRWATGSIVAGVVLVIVGALGLSVRGGGSGPGRGIEGAFAGERRIQFQGADDVRLGATLALPGRPRAPAALIIGALGPTDRDGVTPAGAQPDTLYRDLSEAFTAAGIASLRYDRRGSGQSMLAPGTETSLDDLVADARAGLVALAGRAGVDPDKLVVVGHDMGGIVAMRLAAAEARVKAVVLVSTPGRRLRDVIADDIVNSSGNNERAAPLVAQLDALVEGVLTRATTPSLADIDAALRDLASNPVAFLQALFTVDPAADAAKVSVPALVVRGDAAFGVREADAARLLGSLGGPSEALVSPNGGTTLALPPPPASSSGDHGGAEVNAAHDAALGRPGATVGPRDLDAVGRLTAWMATRLGV
ncbi:MAG: alpha/beta fold hydrolase [Acidimicrobiales bacterium]